MERGGALDVFGETPADQLLTRDRRTQDRGEIRYRGTEGVARHPRLGGQSQTESIEDGARTEKVFDSRPETTVGPLLACRDDADRPLSSNGAHRCGNSCGVAQAPGQDRDRTTGQ